MTDPINDPLSPIRLQIMWDRLIAVVEEQALTLIRTGFSTSTREAGDLSAGVFDITGDMLAQAVTGTPGHVNSMARPVRHFLDRFPVEDMADGDVFLTNDPWKGTGHLHDFTFMTPCFRNGTLVALFASTCHVVDIGGRGMTSDGRSIYEEGLYIPLMRFAHAGKIDQAVIDIVTANVREPVQVIGDLHSLATCNDLACRRLCEMMDEFAKCSLRYRATKIRNVVASSCSSSNSFVLVDVVVGRINVVRSSSSSSSSSTPKACVPSKYSSPPPLPIPPPPQLLLN